MDIRNEVQYLRSSLSRERKRSVALALLLAGALVIIWKQTGNVISTIVPPTIHQSFWVSHDKMSPEYLEEMGTWVAMLATTYTPKSIDYTHDKLKKLVSPAIYGALDIEFEKKKQYVKKTNISSVLQISDVVINQDQSMVVIRGTKQTWVGDKKMPDQQVAIRISFEYTAGIIRLAGIQESDWAGNPVADKEAK